MTQFVPPSDLATQFGFDSSVDALMAALSASSDQATADLAAVLRTQFDAVTAQVDYFSPRSMIRNGPLFEIRLKLSQGFVSQTGFSIVYGQTIQGLVDGTDATAIANPFLDPTKGVVTVYDTDFTGVDYTIPKLANSYRSSVNSPGSVYIGVTYNAGFAQSGGVYTGTPDWMVAAAGNLALVALDENYSAYRGDRAADPRSLARRRAKVETQVFPYTRYVPNAEFPIGQ